MLKIAVGHSEDVDSKDAILEIIEHCSKELEGDLPQAGILFCAIDFEYDVILDEINKAYPNIELIGCTTDGEVSSELGFLEDSITLTLFCSDNIEIKAGIGLDLGKDLAAATEDAVNSAKAKLTKEAKFCITTPESLAANGDEIISSLKNKLGDKFPIFGGLAGDQWQMKQTFQFYKTEVLENAIPILIFAGDVTVSCGVECGWKPIGNKKIVTKAEKGTVFEVDHEPILDFYNHYLGNYEKISSEYAIAVFPDSGDRFYLRSPAVSDEVNKSITFFGEIPEGAVVQLSECTSDGILDATEKAVESAISDYEGENPSVAMIFSCATRKVLLGINIEKEVTLVKEKLDESCKISGFYTYGEIAPLDKNKQSIFHNSTIAVVLIGEN